MDETQIPAAAASAAALDIPPALLPRATDSDLARRATALADIVGGYGASARLDGRFRLAVGDLASAVIGLEGMRACGLAVAVAEEALPQLAKVLAGVERELEQAIPQLQSEQREVEGAREPLRRPRKVRSAAPK